MAATAAKAVCAPMTVVRSIADAYADYPPFPIVSGNIFKQDTLNIKDVLISLKKKITITTSQPPI